MADIYKGGGWALNMGPLGRGFAITPGTDDLPNDTRAIYVGAEGSVTVVLADDGSTVTFAGVPAGTWLWVRARKVTVAAGGSLVGLY